MRKYHSLGNLKHQLPMLEKFCYSELNEKIFRFLRLFVNGQNILIASLIQNPFGKTKNVREIEKHFGPEVARKIENMNKMHDLDPTILHVSSQFQEEIILYLINFNFTLNDSLSSLKKTRKPKPEKILYAIKLLKLIYISEIHAALEDKFFSVLYPDVYQSYLLLLQFTKRKYLARQKEIRQSFEKLMKDNNIKAQIQMRLKTISSIHRKIIRKDLLFSQVLDVIGLRIIVNQEEDCYQSMVLILKNTSILTNRIKDYIASPKENGYQSIHLTIMYENHPVEIQIRTRDMHERAQFGQAGHLSYKSDKVYLKNA